MSLIKGVHHVCLKCSSMEEYEKVIAFYRDVLELPVVRSWSEGTMLDLGGGLLEVFNNAEDSLPQGVIRHFALAAESVDACVKKVTDAGYKVFLGPKDIVIPSDPAFPARIAFCCGPLGEEIEFFEEK